MQKTRFGRTNLQVTRTAFGALPIQRTPMHEAKRILRKAYDAGITLFDTARGYSDSEEKLAAALGDVRKNVIITSKAPAKGRQEMLRQIETSLAKLKTDYVDVYQLHNPAELPDPADPESAYAGLLEAKRKGMVRFIGVSNHRLPVARAAIASGDYDTLQFPLSSISSDEDLALVDECRKRDVGFLAMKALCGGLITNARAAFAFLRQYENVVPIWGIQRESELDEFLALDAHPPQMDEAMRQAIDKDRRELAGEFCRGCGYCLPCAAEIPINMAARMAYLLRRAPWKNFVTPEWQETMHRIEDCTDCGQCRDRCPYGLDPPKLLKKMLADYEEFVAAHPL